MKRSKKQMTNIDIMASAMMLGVVIFFVLLFLYRIYKTYWTGLFAFFFSLFIVLGYYFITIQKIKKHI